MDKSMLELLSKLLGNSSNSNSASTTQSQNNIYTNPSYENYPREAFVQNVNNAHTSNNGFSQGQGNNNNPFSNLFASGDNNILSLLLSLLGKNNLGLSSIFNTLSKKTGPEEKVKKEGDDISPNEEILL